ncbi:MAG: ABC transporter ATP-binding protein [Spirochaetales bacterium]|nr:ABC transporter ATP-binding protein [Spirochaetales bacterium]
MIRLRGLTKSYPVAEGRLEVLKGIDLHVSEGEFVSIMGSSGSGKSTLLNVIGILDDYDGGDYTLGDLAIRDLSETTAAEYRNRFISFVFQAFNLLRFKTALDNVALPLYYQGVKRKERHRIAREYLAKVGLADRADHRPNQLSGGEQQRVAIARSLISRPKVLLADEPTGALDSATSLHIMELLTEINREGITVLLVTHERDIAEMTHRIIHMRDGLVKEDVHVR